MNIYWLLTFLPVWFIFTLTTLGVLGLFSAAFIGKIPFIKTYNLPIRIVATILLVSGVYLQGALAYKDSTALAVAKLEKRLAEAEARSARTNTEIVEKIVKDTQVIREKGRTVTEYVDREVVKHDSKCELPSEVIRAHNAAATLDTSILEGEKK